MTTKEKIAAFKLLIERMKESECSGMCRALLSLWVYGEISNQVRLYILDLIKAELVQQNSLLHAPSAYLFPAHEVAPRIAWCKAKILQLKTAL